MGGPKSLEVELSKEEAVIVKRRYEELLEECKEERLKKDTDIQIAIKKRQQSMDMSDNVTDFEKVSSSERDVMEKLLVYQDIDDFFDSKAEYEAAAILSGIEPFEYEYDKEKIDELLDDIIDTAEVFHETNIRRLAVDRVNDILVNMAEKRGLNLTDRTTVGKKNDGCVLKFAMKADDGKDYAVFMENSAGKLTVYLEDEECPEPVKNAFEDFYKKIHSQFSRNGISIKKEIYNV